MRRPNVGLFRAASRLPGHTVREEVTELLHEVHPGRYPSRGGARGGSRATR